MKQTHDGIRQTKVSAIVQGTEQVGSSWDGHGHMDLSPDRTEFTVVVTAGSKEQFREWLLDIAGNSVIAYGNSMRFADIGGAPWKLEDGATIEISFAEFLDARLNWLTSVAHNAVRVTSQRALERIHNT